MQHRDIRLQYVIRILPFETPRAVAYDTSGQTVSEFHSDSVVVTAAAAVRFRGGGSFSTSCDKKDPI